MLPGTFHYDSAQSLLADSERLLGYALPYSQNLEILASPFEVSGRRFPNRLLAQPIEGFDANADGSPSRRSVLRYCGLAAGGSGTLWMESVSVNREGRSNPMQLWLKKENLSSFRDLTDAVRKSAPGPILLILQLTHSGRSSKPDGIPAPICAFHNKALPTESETIISDSEIDALIEDYVSAAKLAEAAGFDGVDIRACHGYLLNELFAARNRTDSRYGGAFENRTRAFLEIVSRVMAETGLFVGVRLNLYDGIPYPDGWGADPEHPDRMDLTEPLMLVDRLYALGVRLFNVTNGVGACSPFMIRPYDSGGITPTEPPLAGIRRMQQCAGLVKEHAPGAAVIASAFSWLREYGPHVAAGAIEKGWYDLAGFGRLSLAHPSYARDILEKGGLNRKDCCIACCGCTSLIKKSGRMLRCVVKQKAESVVS